MVSLRALFNSASWSLGWKTLNSCRRLSNLEWVSKWPNINVLYVCDSECVSWWPSISISYVLAPWIFKMFEMLMSAYLYIFKKHRWPQGLGLHVSSSIEKNKNKNSSFATSILTIELLQTLVQPPTIFLCNLPNLNHSSLARIKRMYIYPFIYLIQVFSSF